jgi:hypothetical protein
VIRLLALKTGEESATIDETTSRPKLIELLSLALKARRDAVIRRRYHDGDFITKALLQDNKAAEWKLRRRLEASAGWVERRKNVFDAEHDVEIIRTVLGNEFAGGDNDHRQDETGG